MESTWAEKLQARIEVCEQELAEINIKVREAEEGRKETLKKQMEKEARRQS